MKKPPPTTAALPILDLEPKHCPMMTELYRHAEARLHERQKTAPTEHGAPKSAADPQRVLHELEVHQVELEMQNAALKEARDAAESALEKFTDLYDFAPVGYYSLDEQGRILEVNLTGAALLGVERSRLINRPLPRFVLPASRPIFLEFLKKVFAGTKKQVCELSLLDEHGVAFWVDLQALAVVPLGKAQPWCRVAASDITALKRAEEAQRRVEALAASNQKLEREIVQRKEVEVALKQSEQHQRQLLEQARQQQEQLRHLSHQILHAQEEERKRISRELHDQIVQTLVGINVHLETLIQTGKATPKQLKERIARTQRLVEKSVHIVHQFARELRPPLLDDLGLNATLHALLKDFRKQTGLHVHFTTCAAVEQLSSDQRTVLYRVVQSALANVTQHAHASRVKMSLLKPGEAVCLEINDNGKAFDVEQVLNARKNKRLGLLGMRERVEMIGGTLSIESAPGPGTTIRAHIPFDRKSARGGGGENPLTKPTETTL
ncbi:MAG: histidine kinase [Verrucomicrobiota bacterium]